MDGDKRRLSAILGALAFAVSILLVVAAGPAAGAHTLVVSQTRIDGFAQDGRFIAWSANPRHVRLACGAGVTFRNLLTGKQGTFALRPTPCFFRLALAGKHALATTPPTTCGNCYGATVWKGSPLAGLPLTQLETFAESPAGGGDQLTGIAGDRGVLALSWVGYRLANDCSPACSWEVTGGRVNRIVDGRKVRVPGVPPAAILAVGAGRLATAPAVASWQGNDTSTRPAEDGPVNVVDADTGAPVVTVSPTGTVQALALSSDSLAVLLERTDGTHAIERYAIPAGTMMASTSVSGQARDLDVAGKWIVYRVWRRIKLIDLVGARHLLLVAPHRPFDVSIEGNRVAWAENGGGRHRVRAATAPD